EECSPQDNALGLMHLRRLFSELCHPPRHMTQKEQEEKLYMMLPVFNRVFGNAPPSTMTEKFSDVLQFTTQVSRLMVTEIRRRASNKSTEAASRAIVQFLECLYLFFDLPNMADPPGGPAPPPPPAPPPQDKSSAHPELPLADRRALLQKVFVQILVKLCSFVSPAEELAQKDDLQLLFSAITSWCPPHNLPWRRSAGEVLATISRHGLSVNVVKYIHEKECLATCVQNMQQSDDLSPLEIVEMFAGLSCFLKDSSHLSQTLLDDFRMCQGYAFLCDLMLRLEQAKEDESKDALKDLVNLVTCLTTYGVTELKPAGLTTGAPFLLPGFILPLPSGKGNAVRNLQAFSVLQNAFLRAKTSRLARMVLDAIANIYAAEPANYFILEAQHTLSQFADRVAKLPEAQAKYFELLEFVVFNLNYVPCKELFSVSVLLKGSTSHACSSTAVRTLLRLARHDTVFSDVLREVGLLEVLVNLLHKYTALLKDPAVQQTAVATQHNTPNNEHVGVVQVVEEQKQLAWLVMETLTVLLQGSNINAGLFREFGGARCVHNIIRYRQCREQALLIIQQLVVSPSGDDDMGTLLGLMTSAPCTEMELKADILRALLSVLRESHRTRTVFRKVGGFVYVTSLLVAMERSLCQPPRQGWELANQNQVFELLFTIFCTLTAAMRYEPANSHFFRTEIQYEKLADAVRLLGCFSDTKKLGPTSVFPSNAQPFQRLLEEDTPPLGGAGEGVSPTLRHCSKLFIYLYKMATDSFDSRTEQLPPCLSQETSLPSPWGTPALTRKRHGYYGTSGPPAQVKAVTELKVYHAHPQAGPPQPQTTDVVVIHPGAVLAILDLLPSVSSDSQPEHALDLQLAVSNLLQVLVHSERNQQVLCEAGLHQRLLQRCGHALGDEDHPLHPPLQRTFERLASQALLPMALREFLRLGNPLNCGAWDKKLLKQYRVHKPSSLSYDAEMRSSMTTSMEGFGPDSVFTTPGDDSSQYRISRSLVRSSEDSTVPLTRVKCLVSMTTPHDIRLHGSSVTPAFVEFDTSLEGFGSAPHLHPMRLLTMVRRASASEQHYVCLSITLSPSDRSLSVSTKEELLHSYSDESREEGAFYELLPCCARVRCGDQILEGQWHHLVVLHYIHSVPGGSGSANPPVVSTVYGYIGTPPAQRLVSSLLWRLGPSHFLEEVVPATGVAAIYELGPNYVGSFQAVYLPCKDSKAEGVPPSLVSLVPEEKVSFSLYAVSVCSLTVAKIRKVYNKLDSKAIAKQLAVSSHENATPVKLIHNAAGHLNGPARTIGAAVIGYLGVRAFMPKPVATNLQYIGGAAAILGLVAMASDVEGLYAAVKALVCVVKSNPLASKEMERIKGYQLLAMLLKRKRWLLNSHILHLTFSLVGTVDSGHETSIIPNSTAFQDLLCDFEVWLHAPYELHLSLFEHFIELLTESSEAVKNAKLLRDFQLIPRLLLTLRDTSLSQPTVGAIGQVLSLLLQGFPHPYDLLRFGQFISSTLPTFAVCEKFVVMEISNEEKIDGGNDEDFGGLLSANLILLRNRLLDILLRLLFTACEEVVRTLGFDWLLMFLEEHVHSSTVTAALWILVVLLSHNNILHRFKEGLCGGGWLDHTDSVLTNKIGTVLGFNVGRSAGGRSTLREINRDACHFSGFPVLQALLPKHTNVPELYFLLMALFLQQPVTELPDSLQFDLDSIWTFIFGVPASSGAALFFRYMYHNVPDLTPMWHSSEFLCSLAASVFPFNIRPYSEMVSDLDDETGSPMEEFKAFAGDSGMNRSQSEYCNVGSKTYLTNHPAKKYVFDFMRVLIMDNLCTTPATKQTPVLDLLLEQKEFQSFILDGVMDHLLAADVLLGEDSSLAVSGGSYQTLVHNIFYFSQRVVDKLWQGMFNKDSKLVVDFIVQLIGQSKRRSQGVSLDSVYHSLNRTVLFQLCRPHKTVAQQVALLDALRVLTVNRRQLLLKAVARVWTELMHSKRSMLEDIFKVSLPSNDRGHVDVSTARPALEEQALRSWHNHLTQEKKLIGRGEAVTPASQSKLSRRQQTCLKYVTEEWAGIEYELLRERGLWGPPIGSHLDKFVLEMTEGPCRMRKKMVRNDMFYIHYPYVPEPEPQPANSTQLQKPQRYRRAISADSKEYYMRLLSGNPGMYQHSLEPSAPGETNHTEPEHGEDTIARVKGLVKAPLKRSRSTADGGDEDSQDLIQDQLLESGGPEEEERTDNTSLLRLLEEGEKIQHMYRSARVQGLDTSEGLLLFGKEHFYVIDGYTMTVSREIRDIDTLPPNLHEAIIPRGARQGQSQLKRTASSFAYEDIKEVHKRRYLLQPMAVEVFSADGRNYLLAFQKGVRNKVYQRFLAVVPSLADSSESVSGQRPNTSVEQGSGLLSTLVGEKSVTQRWERGEISNFQYLMHLNTLAGRSYNDLMQYPVFPWVLADYDSQELDLNNPATFRNLSKPMGAQTDDRLTQYKKRFKDWEDPNGETPAYHYGTHYSSAMIVASYLVRMEPFTQIFLRLQGGHFDLADRMFHSVREAWLSASKHNMADVKELIPEFFYLPEFMLNSNNFDLGAKQNGTKLGDVILPPWAKGDPREFIRVHRQALECDYVSAHLHEWIDLIFGYKQQGPPAVEAVNVFHHLFYEGQVDIYNINDPLKETATIGFINNFGQIPKQLFKRAHPPKRVRGRTNGEPVGLPLSFFFHHLDNLRPSLAPLKELKEPVGQIVCTDKGVMAVEQNKVLLPPSWSKTFAWGYADLSCRLGNYESDKASVVYECLSEWGQILCAICPNPKLVITAGTSTSICVWEMGTSKEKAKSLTLKQALLGHTDAVTCLMASSSYHMVVSGSRDRTCIIWDLNKLAFVTQLRGHRAPVSALCINELTHQRQPHLQRQHLHGPQPEHPVLLRVGDERFWRMEFLQVPETPAPEPVETDIPDCCAEEKIEGAENHQGEEESSESDGDEPSLNQEPKTPPTSSNGGDSHPGSSVHRPKGSGGRSGPSWSLDSGSDDSRHWSDTLSIDEKDGFVFINYSEGQSRPGRPPGAPQPPAGGQHPGGPQQQQQQQPAQPSPAQPPLGSVPQTALQPGASEPRPYSLLRAGYRWERQLVFRSKLTMHTAFERKDNGTPAEITALAISKDHSKVMVGDGRGRVFSWSVSEQPGRSAADHWVKDEVVDSCSGCSVRFSLTERRHHCRNCGQLFCHKCSRFQSEIRRLKISSPVRVCQTCYQTLQN
ncbi:hypothetical protein CRUP_007502, partial [Coryphaenoides rupestris]